jgi:molybdate transport system substrate-binding protein
MSIGQPESVPAGKYAKEALTSLDLWSKVESKIVYAKDVRQVLTYVETGNVDAGLVYRSDVIGAGKTVKIIAAAPKDSHKPIIYPMAILKSSKNKEETAKFADFLKGKEAAKIFEKYGFQPIKK